MSMRSKPLDCKSDEALQDVTLIQDEQQKAAEKERFTSASWDHSSHEQFVAYYAEKSLRPEQLQHFRSVRQAILRILRERNKDEHKYDMVDIGCNAGGQCAAWAEEGHRVHGLDINEPLLEVAKRRAKEAGHNIDYRLGTATELPWPDRSMDVCIAMELLEHVRDWQRCINEFNRILRPGGALLLTTTNTLCPRQSEFNLPAYSWYPAGLKRHFENLAVTTRPELANHAKYPAVNWFDPYSLGAELASWGFIWRDRFDLVDTAKKGILAKVLVGAIRALPPLRLLAHFCTSGTMVLGLKE